MAEPKITTASQAAEVFNEHRWNIGQRGHAYWGDRGQPSVTLYYTDTGYSVLVIPEADACVMANALVAASPVSEADNG